MNSPSAEPSVSAPPRAPHFGAEEFARLRSENDQLRRLVVDLILGKLTVPEGHASIPELRSALLPPKPHRS